MGTAADVIAFFAWSNDTLDYLVLRPLSHIASSWELSWDQQAQRYWPEEDSFGAALNQMIFDLAHITPPQRYHDHEDRLAEYAIAQLKWPIRKIGGRWVGADYDSLLEQGGCHDVDQADLLLAAAGRVHAALKRGQMHFDDMEISHRRMLGTVLSIILYHRGPEP